MKKCRFTKRTRVSMPSKQARDGIEGQSGIILPLGDVTSTGKTVFDDLPLYLRTQVESIIKWRKKMGLLDDSKERKETAVKYFKGRLK